MTQGSGSQTISVRCGCGKKLKAPASAVGRKAKCPSCGNVLLLEAPPPVDEESDLLPLESEPSDDFSAALNQLAAQEAEVGANAESIDTQPRCPGCSKVIPPNAVVCVNCGYNTKTGKALKVATATTATPKTPTTFAWPGSSLGTKKKPVDKLAPERSFFLGLLLSVAFGVAASIPWLIVAFTTDRDFYILELVVGLGAGFGMVYGQRGYSSLGGWTAAGVTFVVLIAMRVILVIALIMPAILHAARAAAEKKAELAAMTAHQREIEERDPRVAHEIALNLLKAKGIDEEAADNDEKHSGDLAAAENAGELKLKSIDQKEYLALLARVQEKEAQQRLIAEMMDPQLRKMGLNPSFQRIYPEQYEAAHKEILKQIAAMTPAQKKAELQKLDQAAQDEREAWKRDHPTAVRGLYSGHPDKLPGEEKEDAEEAVDAPSSGSLSALLLVFAIWPLVCAVFAMLAAYKTAAGGVSG